MIEKYRCQHLPESARMTSNFFLLSLREICMTTFCLLSWMVPLSSQLKNLIEAVVATTRSLHKFYGVFFIVQAQAGVDCFAYISCNLLPILVGLVLITIVSGVRYVIEMEVHFIYIKEYCFSDGKVPTLR